jgi:Asp-tRNA(Asn)/Glu-tRNA(Gln) amidotransferase A subunit family amidase
MSIPTNFLTATETRALLGEGKVSLTQVVKDHQARHQARDSAVHAWVCTIFDGALALAAGGGTKGLPLHGVVIAVKDIISTYTLQPHT